MIGIVDYGVGNLFSLSCSFEAVGRQVIVSSDKRELEKADKLLLPGVGAFGDASARLFSSGMAEVILDGARKGKPILGICLGMQLLFEEGEEFGVHRGLGLLSGRVRSLRGVLPEGYKIPHIGWNALIPKRENPLTDRLPGDAHVYFVHSFFADCPEDEIVATAEYGVELPAVTAKDHVFGCQFHPEKSGRVGLSILKAFADLS